MGNVRVIFEIFIEEMQAVLSLRLVGEESPGNIEHRTS
jgi:hypothetical protein